MAVHQICSFSFCQKELSALLPTPQNNADRLILPDGFSSASFTDLVYKMDDADEKPSQNIRYAIISFDCSYFKSLSDYSAIVNGYSIRSLRYFWVQCSLVMLHLAKSFMALDSFIPAGTHIFVSN
jgi:hypothetical protein